MKQVPLLLVITLFAVPGFSTQWHTEADRLWNEGIKLKQQRQYEKSIDALKRAILAERKNNNPRFDELVNQLDEIGNIYAILGEHEKALHYYKLLSKVAGETGNPQHIVLSAKKIGDTYANLKRYDEAIDIYLTALSSARKMAIKDSALLILDSLGRIYREKQEYSQSILYYEDALTMAVSVGSTVNIAVINSNIGSLYYYQHNFEKALYYYGKALDFDKKNERHFFVSMDISNIACVYSAIGRYGEAVNYFEQALEIDLKNGNDLQAASRLYRLADIYGKVGDSKKALEFYNRSLEINIREGNKLNIAEIHTNIGEVYESIGKYDEAIDEFLKGLSISREIENRDVLALRMSDIGLAYENRGRHGEAVEFYSKALLGDVLMNKNSRAANVLNSMGRIMIKKGDFTRALQYCSQSLSIYRSLKDDFNEAVVLNNIGIIHCLMKEYEKAKAILLESLKKNSHLTGNDRLKTQLIEEDSLAWLALTHVRNNEPKQALRFINQGSSLYTDIRLGKSQSKEGKTDDKQNEELIPGKGVAYIIYTNMSWDAPLQLYVSADGIFSQEINKESFVKEVYTRLGKEIEGRVVKGQGSWFISDYQRISKNQYQLDFQKIIEYYRRLLMKPYITDDENRQLKYLSQAIYKLLFSSFENRIAGLSELIIQPDGILEFIPFEALIMPDGRYLVERFTISYQITTQSMIESKSIIASEGLTVWLLGKMSYESLNIKRIIVESLRQYIHLVGSIKKKIDLAENLHEVYRAFLDADLNSNTNSIAEYDGIALLFSKARLMKNTGATEDSFKKLATTGGIKDVSMLHIAGVLALVPEIPELSAIVLGFNRQSKEDGFLIGREIAQLSIPVSLLTVTDTLPFSVVYSRGSTFRFLCSSMKRAGVKNASFSLWQLEDQARLRFYQSFYEVALSEKLSFKEAMTKIKRSFIRNENRKDTDSVVSTGEAVKRYGNPYYWASFVLYGLQ